MCSVEHVQLITILRLKVLYVDSILLSHIQNTRVLTLLAALCLSKCKVSDFMQRVNTTFYTMYDKNFCDKKVSENTTIHFVLRNVYTYICKV